MSDAAPTPPPSESPPPAGPAIGPVSGDVVMGNKTVNLTAGGDIVLGNKITNVSNIYQVPSWGEAKYQRNRQAMIQIVRDIWIKGVLDSSLYGAVLIPLGLEYQPEAVEQPWHLDPAARAVPAETRKLDLFDQASGALLILGQPGAGKTTSLLELARALLERAEQNPTAPVPAVFSLASWAEKHPPLETWLAEELFRRYDVPRVLGRAWLQDDMLIPLLDGLDEVRAEQREACAHAINAFRDAHGLAPLVVCSRLQDYEALGTRLRLRQALVVQPLSPAQVDAHLAQFGEQQAALRQAVAVRADLRELAGTPLMLGVLMVVYQGQPAIALSGSPAEQRTDLFSQYVGRMLARSDELRVYSPASPNAAQPDRSPYPDRLARHWLAWLARVMRRNGQTQFHLEWMQPGWLASPAQAALVTLGTSALVGLAIGLVFGALNVISTGGSLAGWAVELVAGLSGGLAGGLIRQCAMRWRGHNPAVPAGGAWRSAVAAVATVLGGGLVLAGLLIAFGQLASDLPILAVLGWGAALAGGLVGYSPTIAAVEQVHWSWRGWRAGLRGVLVGGSATALVAGLLAWPLAFGVVVLDPTNTDPLLVKLVAAWFAAGLGNFVGGLLFWMIGGLVGGLIGMLRGSLVTAGLSTRHAVNEGMWRSARSALAAMLIWGVGAAAVFALIGWGTASLPEANADPLQASLGSALAFGLSLALIGGCAYGGRAVVQHSLLRLLLWANGVTPRPGDYPRFLDYAADRVLLRKLGGGYIFIHPLLMDYLAGLEA